MHNSLEAVAYDLFPNDSLVRRLYESESLMRFVAAVLDAPVLHRYADPFGALNLAVMRDGDVLGWHFDMTDFVVSIAIQSSTSGGDFLNAKRVRSAQDECYDDVASGAGRGRGLAVGADRADAGRHVDAVQRAVLAAQGQPDRG